MMLFAGLVVLAMIVMVLVLALARGGKTLGRTPLMPGTTLVFTRTSNSPWISMVPKTTLQWRGYSFVFALVHLADGRFRAYIISDPGYGRWSVSLGATHRLADSGGRKYICWVPEPRNANQMAGAVALWVAGTCRYLETGVFPDKADAAHEFGGP